MTDGGFWIVFAGSISDQAERFKPPREYDVI